jgi:hypothetical protein
MCWPVPSLTKLSNYALFFALRRLSGQGYAKEAVKLNGKHFLALKWAAVTTGSLTEHLGTKEKIQEGYVFKVSVFPSNV